jgi:hypothetical protein
MFAARLSVPGRSIVTPGAPGPLHEDDSMRMLKAVLTSAVIALGLGGAGAANALTLLPGPGCDIGQLTTSTACAGTFAGNDANQSLDGLFGVDGWTELAKVDSDSGTGGILTVTGGGTSGSWSVSGWDGLTRVMAVLKGGPSFSAYLLDLGSTGGSWTTAGLARGNGQAGPGLSHFTLYAAPIPLPAGGVLLLTALGGLALARRRKA